MPYGCAQQRGGFLECRYSGVTDDLDVGAALATHLVDKRSHSINTRIATTDDGHRLPLLSHLESLSGTVALTFHTRIDTLRVSPKIWLHELEIVFISHHHVGLLNSLDDGRSNILPASRAKANDIDSRFLHIQSNICRHKVNK